jgi:glycosyltransferase involved in cell wall biosynthesis
MRVAIEAAALTLSSGGLARYTGELSLALARRYAEDEFFLISDQPFTMPPGPPPNLRRGGSARNTLERRWWLWGIARELKRLGADLIHGPDFSVPYIPARPSVLTLHDLSPWMNQEWHGDAARVRRRTPMLLEMGIATMVITPSEAVRKQAMQRFHLRADRVIAIPEAAAPWFQPVRLQAVRTEPAEPPADSRYFLFVGTIEPRKNLATLLEAWREVRREFAIDLVIAGRRRADAAPIQPEPGLRLPGEVPDEQLPALYSGALAFCYPSFYEGFGLPVLEAMQCGCAVIASRAVQEVAGQAAIYADSPHELAQAMREVALRPDRMAERQAQSLMRARQFTWDRTAQETYAVYREARNRFAR